MYLSDLQNFKLVGEAVNGVARYCKSGADLEKCKDYYKSIAVISDKD